ncbi:MAG: alpha/beta hydrolase family protein [Planctomycetota bacterium]|jgi:poly(3-hydroxybutyrate) depolymerase
MRRTAIAILILAFSALLPAQTFDVSLEPGANYDKANFRLWVPKDLERLHAALVLVPGSNGDGRGQVEDEGWQKLAKKHGLALVGVQMTDRRHEQMFIEEYVDVKRGSGDALLQALEKLAKDSEHPELAKAPLLFWGMSAGGQFNYEFALWKPERTLAFVVNKGGIYYSAQASKAAQMVPGMFFIGETDLEYRNDIIAGIFAINRRAGALWALAVEPGVGHQVAGSKALALEFYDKVISMRLPEAGDGKLLDMDRDAGFIADPKTKEILPAADAPRTSYPTSWLPTEALANSWRELVSGKN